MMDAHLKILPQPIFHEPFFNEDKPSPDPTGFETKHPSDNATYKRIENLLTKDVVEVPSSRVADDAVFGLDEAYGAHGAEVLVKIKKAGRIIFHSCGDSGASTTRKCADELRVADQRRRGGFAAVVDVAGRFRWTQTKADHLDRRDLGGRGAQGVHEYRPL